MSHRNRSREREEKRGKDERFTAGRIFPGSSVGTDSKARIEGAYTARLHTLPLRADAEPFAYDASLSTLPVFGYRKCSGMRRSSLPPFRSFRGDEANSRVVLRLDFSLRTQRTARPIRCRMAGSGIESVVPSRLPLSSPQRYFASL